MTSAIAIIPARFGSTRYPGKPLLRETGKFLIQHVCDRVASARRITRCIVATDDARIFDAVRSFGGDVVMTSPDHPSGTDRLAEVVRGIPEGAPGNRPNDLILNVQGDEPEIEPGYLDQLVERMQRESQAPGGSPMGTLACPFPADVDPSDPNCVKVVFDQRQRALYFSRSLLPYPREMAPARRPRVCHLHLGVYAYQRQFLLQYAQWQPTVLEGIEKLEQLRVLEHGFAIAVEIVPRATPGVDTPADYQRFVARWRQVAGAGGA